MFKYKLGASSSTILFICSVFFLYFYIIFCGFSFKLEKLNKFYSDKLYTQKLKNYKDSNPANTFIILQKIIKKLNLGFIFSDSTDPKRKAEKNNSLLQNQNHTVHQKKLNVNFITEYSKIFLFHATMVLLMISMFRAWFTDPGFVSFVSF